MKKNINVLTIIVIILSFFLVNSRCNLKIEVPGVSPEKGGKEIAFEDFPLDKQKFIDIKVDEDTFDNFTPREQKDQVLDWLLYTTVYSSGMTAETLSEILFDLPPIRYGYMHSIANFEFGDTRSCVIGDNSIIALIPRDIPENQYKDYLAGIADKHRKDLGEIPKVIHIFRYKINLKEKYALLKRCREVNANDFFTTENGYYTATVKNLTDFKQFMEKIEDITCVEVVDQGLTLGGRKLKEPYRGIRVEDVAAIWQAEKDIRDRQKNFTAKWQHNLDLLKTKLDEYNGPQPDRIKEDLKEEGDEKNFDKDDKFKYLDEYVKKYLEQSPDKRRNIPRKKEKSLQVKKESVPEEVGGYRPPEKIISAKHYELEFKKFQEMMQADFIKARMAESAGFSLDPTYNFKELQEAFSGSLFKIMTSLEPTLIKKEEVQKAVDELHDKNIVPLLVIFDKLKRCDDKTKFFVEIFEAMIENHRFQAARYDGPLQGTEVGMVLFYTDLLAKLWALDYQDSIPANAIDDFIPLTEARISKIYKQEIMELPSTRLWFGTNDKGFQKIGDSNQLLFARVASRVYAASSNPLHPGQEVKPNAASAAFLGWWNDHYEEIARYEPEYQRQNEIMKWSILIAWLNDANKGHYLDFLKKVKVNKGNWFTEWVKSQPNLKFKKWDKVKFYDKGHLGTDTEAMAILSSKEYKCFGHQWTISGGVSLARGYPKRVVKLL
ncbi:MAG: hypothetical protein MUF15_14595 [Acidobacteria bacterium]|jgi:hypothetical protein|nr:hypothetical protein [Acidobacteriota bacterium]